MFIYYSYYCHQLVAALLLSRIIYQGLNKFGEIYNQGIELKRIQELRNSSPLQIGDIISISKAQTCIDIVNRSGQMQLAQVG